MKHEAITTKLLLTRDVLGGIQSGWRIETERRIYFNRHKPLKDLMDAIEEAYNRCDAAMAYYDKLNE